MAREFRTRVISFDPNIRPGFIRDKQKHIDRVRRMVAMSDIIKFSDEDLDWFGMSCADAPRAAPWLAPVERLVVLSLGPDDDRTSVVSGKSVSDGVYLCGWRL